MSQQVTILGSGVAGLASAVALLEAGFQVRVIEQQPQLGAAQCSWVAGGMIAPYCEQVLAEPEITALGKEALPWWQKHHSRTVKTGSLVVAAGRDRAELDYFASRTQGYVWLNKDELAELEPDLAGRFQTALYFQDEGYVEPELALTDLAQQLATRGVEFFYDTPAESFLSKLPPSKQPFILDCRGYGARQEIPTLRGVRGEMLLIQSAEFNLKRPLRLLHPRGAVYLIPRSGGRFMVGGTQIESSEPGPVTLRSAVHLLNSAYAVHPVLAEAQVLVFQVGIRPALPNNLPKLWQQNNRWYLNGLFRHGYLLAPAMAQQVTDTFTQLAQCKHNHNLQSKTSVL